MSGNNVIAKNCGPLDVLARALATGPLAGDIPLTDAIDRALEERGADAAIAADPAIARAIVRARAGLDPVENQGKIDAWIDANSGSWDTILGQPLSKMRRQVLSLGPAGARIVEASAAQDREGALAAYRAFQDATPFDVGIGSWLEKRTVYSTDAYVSARVSGQRRNMHLGYDLFTEPLHPLYCPTDARVVCSERRDMRLDYGGLVVLEHEISSGISIWSLWGHLTTASAQRWKKGDVIPKGTQFAAIGDFEENGWWLPHLHLQLSLLPYDDFSTMPGVGEEAYVDVWRKVFPDPARLILK
jgi:hypothetical protein